MNKIFAAAVSAIRAFGTKAESHAHNVANSNTENFHPDEVTFESAEGGGVTARVSPAEAYSVDLSEEMIGLMSAENGLEANVATVRTADEMIGTIIDIVA